MSGELRMRSALVATFGFLACLVLSSCSASSGENNASVESGVQRELGAKSVSISHTRIAATFGSTEMVSLKLEQPSRNVNDPAALATYLVESAYAWNGQRPSGGIRVSVSGYDGASLGKALEADDPGWGFVAYDDADPEKFAVSWAALSKHLGHWPGRAPKSLTTA